MKEKLKLIAANKVYSAMIIFVFAFIFRIVLLNTCQVNKIAPDGTGYHTLGVNLAKGNGLTLRQEKPFEKFYFREPVYPVFLGLCYKVYGIFGGTYNYITAYDLATRTYDSTAHHEIFFVKYVQAIFDSLSVVVFYLILLLVFKSSFAFVVALLFCFNYPVAIHSVYILRETIQLFITLCMSYSFALFLFRKKWLWLAVFSCLWGLSNLTLQVTVVIPFFMFFFLLFHLKNIYRVFSVILISTLIMFVFISPWLIKVYRFYPDIRIVKTFGCSLTYEMLSYFDAIDKLQRNHKLTSVEATHLRRTAWGLNSFEQFKKSFDGTYLNFAASVDKKNLKSLGFFMFIKIGIKRFYHSWFNPISSLKAPLNFLKNNPILISLLVLTHIVIAGFAFIGLFVYYKKIYPILLTFTTFILLFYFLGSEERRLIPAQPFIFMFGCLGIYYLYIRFFKKSKKSKSVLADNFH